MVLVYLFLDNLSLDSRSNNDAQEVDELSSMSPIVVMHIHRQNEQRIEPHADDHIQYTLPYHHTQRKKGTMIVRDYANHPMSVYRCFVP